VELDARRAQAPDHLAQAATGTAGASTSVMTESAAAQSLRLQTSLEMMLARDVSQVLEIARRTICGTWAFDVLLLDLQGNQEKVKEWLTLERGARIVQSVGREIVALDQGLLMQLGDLGQGGVLADDRRRIVAQAVRECDGQVPDLQTVLAFPLAADSRANLGLVVLGSSEPRHFGQFDLDLLRTFSSHLGAALRLVQAHSDLRRLAAIVEGAEVAIIANDLVGRITHWNPHAELMFGYKASEVIGRSVELLMPKDRMRELCELMEKVRAGQSVSRFESRRLTRSGNCIDVALTLSPFMDESGRLVGASTIACDIGEQRRAEERFRLAVNSAPAAMVLVDGQGVIALANNAALRLFGYEAQEIMGHPLEVLLPPEQRDIHRQHRDQYSAAPTTRAMGHGKKFRAQMKSGEVFEVEIGLNPIRSGSETYVLASVINLSEEHRVIAERQRLLEELYEAVSARDTFISIASHELRTPLTALQLTVQALIRNMNRGLSAGETHAPDNLKARLSAVARQVSRLDTLVGQLLDVSRIAVSRLTLDRAAIDLVDVTSEVIERFSGDSERAKGTIHFIRPDGPVWGYWDQSRIDEIMTNLVGNALKYGEGMPVEVWLEQDDAQARILVRDQGRGIPPEDQERIFGRFERAVSDRSFGGLGLGLWLARQIVEAHGGTIRVESSPGVGSLFVVALPKDCGPHRAGPG
jgi:PAS domain S-box-containing protein